MRVVLQPWQLLFLSVAGWVHREQQHTIAYLRTENAVLREKLGKRRLWLNDEQRRRLALKAKVLGRRLLTEIATLVTPDTLLRWHCRLVAQKWDTTARRQTKGGRPAVSADVQQLVLCLARENPTWGYDRIQGALANLGHDLADTTVGNILKAHGIEPAPQRKRQTSWMTFIRSHWYVLAAIDFTTIEVWTRKGLVTFYLLFAMHPSSRGVHFAGCTTAPDEIWMKPIALDLTNGADGFFNGKRYVLMDRDAKF